MNNQQIDMGLLKRIWIHHDLSAKEELVMKYLPMVKRIVRSQAKYFSETEDLIQEGLIGLLKAIEEFDMERYAIKFSTFAYICITRKVFNAVKYTNGNKQKALNNAVSLYAANGRKDRMLLEMLENSELDPVDEVEKLWVSEHLDRVLYTYLSLMEYEVMKRIIGGMHIREIGEEMRLSLKKVDNARTRARQKLKKFLKKYGSFINPAIPLKSRRSNVS